MCGIAGFAGTGSQGDLERMIARLHLRGPDATQTWLGESPHVGLAHARLSILDHAGGGQPMWSSDQRLAIVFNGVIYNFAQLRSELQAAGCAFGSDHSDTEVLLQGYRHWGEGFVERLNGMWAFVIADFAQGRLFASRDRFGKKPLYYRHHGHGFVFASQADALRDHPAARDATLDTLALKKYFAYGYIPAPRTAWQGICKLPAGHNLTYDLASGKLAVQRYWRFLLEPGPVGADCEGELLHLLQQAVDCRLVADVPVGTFLSGGIDSSLVTALAHRTVGPQLASFSIGFDEPGFDESPHAGAVAHHLGCRHTSQMLGVDEALPLVEAVLAGLDEPMADASIVPTWLVSRTARQQVTVALGGDGADELFAGYGPFKALRWAALLDAVLPQAGIRALDALVQRLPVSHGYMSLDFQARRFMAGMRWPPEQRLAAWMAPVEPYQLNTLVRDGTIHASEEIFSEVADTWAACPQAHPGDKALQFFTELYLQEDILAKVDRASMQHSLEVRAPILDIRVADFARRLPLGMKLQGGQTKAVLKRAAAGLLPPATVQRRKQGFALPVGRWFQQGRLDVALDRLPGAIDRAWVAAALQRHRTGQKDERLALWACLVAERTLR
jgi:asparagine synthase (glutamine-hydrolysing)